MNNILAADSYKLSHFLQYPKTTEYVSSYVEARGVSNDFPNTNEIVNVGGQVFRQDYLEKPVLREHVDEADEIARDHGVRFNRQGWDTIVHEFDGFTPLRVQTLPEGMIFPIGVPQAQIINTDPRFFWLTSYVETALLRALWYPSTVATLSREVKKVIKGYLDKTSDDPSVINFMLHDFGARGVSSGESAALGGMGHLVNFLGSDTLESIALIRRYYDPKRQKKMPAFSVNAAEHATITSWADFGGEASAYENMIDQFAGDGKIYAVVSDSYDIFNAVEKIWGELLRDKVIARGGRLVVRPDSGDPATVVGRCLEILAAKFGYTTNSKGFKVLHPSVRVIQGDGVNYQSIRAILHYITGLGFSAENVVFGMGGALLQKVNRDSLKYAMKASAIRTRDGKWHDVFKDPVTDKGKRSKKGRLAVAPDFKVYREGEIPEADNLLQDLYLHSKTRRDEYKPIDFDTVRERASV